MQYEIVYVDSVFEEKDNVNNKEIGGPALESQVEVQYESNTDDINEDEPQNQGIESMKNVTHFDFTLTNLIN